MLTPVDDVVRAFCETVVDTFATRPGPRFAFVLSGGPTARACYEALAVTDGIEWPVVDLYVGDERFVPHGHEDANVRMITETLLDRIGPVGSFEPMPTGGTAADCAAAYQRIVADLVTGPGIDLIHMGMGPDGHTASLFPGAASLDAGPGELVVATEDPAAPQSAPAPHPHPAGHQLGPHRGLHGGRRHPRGRRGRPRARRGPAGGPGPRRAPRSGWSTPPRVATPPRLAPMLSDRDLLRTPLADLTALARGVRDEAHGRRVTFSPKVFIPLTMLCRDRCGYCTFAKAPARLASPYLTPDEVLSIARAGRDAGCHEALFTLGERPELRYPVARDWLAAQGYASTVDYLAAMCRLVLEETGLLPHANAGALFPDELARLREVSASQGMMLESLAEGLAAHRGAPDKEPARRLATLEAAGELAIPFTTGILVGIGDDRADQLAALHAIAGAHARHGHVQEVIVQNFLPKPGTAMAKAAPCPPEDLQWAIAAARLVLPPDDPRAGATQPLRRSRPAAARRHRRLGRGLPRHRRPREPRARLAGARGAAGRHRGGGPHARPPADGLSDVRPRPRALARPGPALRRARRLGCRRPGPRRGVVLGRRGTPARAARRDRPPRPHRRAPAFGSATSAAAVAEILAGVALGHEVGEDEIVTLFAARGPEVRAVAEVADDLRRATVGDAVTYVHNRNINYTNVCTFKCRFCAFSKGPLSLNLRGAPYLLELDEITRRVAEAEAEGATEVCLQGGIHPNFDGEYYLHVLEAVRAASSRHPHPRLHRARGDRGRPPLRGAAGRLPHPAEGRRAQDPPGHRGRDPR